MERAFSYFIIPFKFSENNTANTLFSATKWCRVKKASTCELHDYITDHFFCDKDEACKIYDYEAEEKIFCNSCKKTLNILFLRIFAYTNGISFAIFCIQYDDSFSVDDVIQLNSRLKFLSTNKSDEFSENNSSYNPDTFNTMEDNILVRKLKKHFPEITIKSKKALMCVYTVCPPEKMNKETLFHLSTGNGSSFRYNDDIAFTVYTQSNNVMHGLSREGIALIACGEGNNFFSDKSNPYGLIGNYRENYLLIYIILLCQYYGFRDFNNKALSLYTESSRKFSVKKLEKLRTEADIFYLRNVHSDVSQITHQNRIYELLLQIYSINSLINDFKEDMNICSTLAEQKKLSNRMIFIMISALIAAIAGITEFLSNFTSIIDFFK